MQLVCIIITHYYVIILIIIIITNSGKYLSKKYNIGFNVDKNNSELQVEGVVHDILTRFFRLCYDPDFEKKKDEYLKSLVDEKNKLAQIDKYLENKKYLVSDDQLTFIDFKFFSYLDYNIRLDKGFLDQLQNVNRYFQSMNNMDFVKRFQEAGLRNLGLVRPGASFGFNVDANSAIPSV